MNHFVAWFVKITGFIPQLFYFRKKIYYENKKKQGRKIKGGAIVVSNHQSLWDFPLLMFVFVRNNMYTLVGEVMFNKTPILTWLLKRIGCIKVERYKHDMSYMEKAQEVLNKGKVLEIYPEGRLPLKHEKDLLAFKPGAIHLALTTKKPIIPVYHSGEYGKERIKVIIGEPINIVDKYDNSKSEKENIELLTEMIKNKIIDLREQLNEREEKKK